MRQETGCNIGDRWQVTARAETEKRVEIGRNRDQDNITKIGNGIPEQSGVDGVD